MLLVLLKSLTRKAPNTTIAEFANIVDPDASGSTMFASGSARFALYSLIFQHNTVYIESFFRKFADVILSSAFLALNCSSVG